jgi:hypothetical protein
MWRLPILLAGLLAAGMAAGRARAETSKSGPMAKVGPDLAVLYDEYTSYLAQGGGAAFPPSNSLLRVSAGRVAIDAVASGDVHALQADLEALGLQGAVAFGRIVSGQLPIAAIERMAALASLQFARPAYATTRVGPLSPGVPYAPTPSPPHKKGNDLRTLD